MLEQQKDIDAVIIATPDHMHAVIASAAMDLGKHVYVQKPMAWCVSEARHLARRAAETKVQAQCGNQRHSADDNRRGVDYITSGVIGDVTQVHVWTNRPIWPQGIPRPAPLHGGRTRADASASRRSCRPASARSRRRLPPPSTLVVGSVPRRGAGRRVQPDLSPVQLARLGGLGTGRPRRHGRAPDRLPGVVAGSRSADGGRDHVHAVQRPHVPAGDDDALRLPGEGTPAGGAHDVVRRRVHAADAGGTRRRRAAGRRRAASSTSARRASCSATRACRRACCRPALHNSTGAPKETLARVPHQAHEMNWIRAIKGQDTLSSPFSYAAHLHEIMLLGLVSLRAKIEDPLRRRQHARHQQRQRQPVPDAGVQGRLALCLTPDA